ncbi:hypothetical protein HNQ34_002627 [Anoxybacillus tepidamans]|uniref:Uncharacterized protein n=1 Tax=Anoxybacteroides tepidamans TaxID=265948 RepID=A0A7W8MWN0_9BACL|nr:hypothetical protein [Anoxybacillus tepidamans]MBB5325526.1 hypothetical protein [Anoxybacillus tepidamans]
MGQKPPNQQIQLQQKLIHYRSEIAKYEHQVKTLEAERQKEKLRNEYLLEKLRLAESVHIEPYEKKIAQLEQQLLSYEVALEEAERQIQHLKKTRYTTQEEKKPSVTKAQALFTYSILLPETTEEETLVIGDFVIQNLGTEALQNIIVCIRIHPKKAAELSGKIAIPPLKATDQDLMESATEWAFAYENWREKIKNDGEYWIKPIHLAKFMPNEEVRLSHFYIRIKKIDGAPSTVIDGFVYCNELPHGISSLNNIIINS